MDITDVARSKIGSGYWWGAKGETATRQRLDTLISWHGRNRYYFTEHNAEKWFGKQVFDCSGLITWCMKEVGHDIGIMNTYSLFATQGPEIQRSELRRNDLCYSSNLGHVGIYTGEGVVHARSTFFGVMETPIGNTFSRFQRITALSEETQMRARVRDFQKRNDLTVDGIVGPNTIAKAKQVFNTIEYILSYDTEKILKEKNGIKYVEVDPLRARFKSLPGTPVSMIDDRNFAVGPFALTTRPVWMVVQDGEFLYNVRAWDYLNGPKGTFVIYKSGAVQTNTLYSIKDVSNIHLAFQGFNLDYEKNGSRDIFESIKKESFLSDVGRPCPRIGYGYNGNLVIAMVNGDAEALRVAIRNLGCVDSDGNTVGIGVDAGSMTALKVDGEVVFHGGGLQRYVITF